MSEKQGFGKSWAAYRPSKGLWFWSCIASIILTMLVGFSWGGWVTNGTAQKMSASAASTAEAQLAAAYCVTAFEKAPDAATQLAALKKTESWQRNDFINKGGWDKLPGEHNPVDGAANLCAQKLMSAKLTPAKATTTSG